MRGITFIGMPGSGKSTIGKQLAERLGLDFIDLDIFIKEHEGQSHDAFLDAHGNSGLVNLEEAHTLRLNLKNTVFAPGGSIIYSSPAMEKLKNETTGIFLDVPLPEIVRRLGPNIEARGIVGLKEKGLSGVFNERIPLYKTQAHYTIPFSHQTIAEIVEEIIRIL